MRIAVLVVALALAGCNASRQGGPCPASDQYCNPNDPTTYAQTRGYDGR